MRSPTGTIPTRSFRSSLVEPLQNWKSCASQSVRHTFNEVDEAKQAPARIARALEYLLVSGLILLPSLLSRIDTAIESKRRLLSDLPLIVEPRLSINGKATSLRRVDEIPERLVFSGIGGSGKSMAALIALRRIANATSSLPLVLAPRMGHAEISDLIIEAMNSVPFTVGEYLLKQWERDGRLALLVDDVDSVSGTERRLLHESLSRWAEENPRCRVMCCGRQLSSLEGFTSSSMAPLDHEQVAAITASIAGSDQVRVSANVQDLAIWPLWLIALLLYGPGAETGLDLLDSLTSARFKALGMTEAEETTMLRSAASSLARAVWPGVSCGVDQAINTVAGWAESDDTKRLFTPGPAADVLGLLARGGLIEIGSAAVTFPHRLLATLLAAEDYVRAEETTIDRESTPFVAAIYDREGDDSACLKSLACHDILTAARYLRLARRRDPTNQPNLRSIADALEVLDSEARVDICLGEGGWLAFRLDSDETRIQREGFHRWSLLSGSDIWIWNRDQLAGRSATYVAVALCLANFRAKTLRLAPTSGKEELFEKGELRSLLRAPDLSEHLLDCVDHRERARKSVLRQLGLDSCDEFVTHSGYPRLILTVRGDATYLSETWGQVNPSFEMISTPSGEPPSGSWESLGKVLVEAPEVSAFRRLRAELESAIGCRLDSQSWSKPELVAAWSW
jgi:hypothetical protein